MPWKTYLALVILAIVLGALWHNGVLQKGWHDARARLFSPPAATQPVAAKPEAAAAAPVERAKGGTPPAAK